jgi:hypothetical protein
MFYDINFIIGLLITLLLSTFAYFYFSQKIDEQNEKLNAVSMVVRAMAEEMAYFRNTGQTTLLEKAPLAQGGDLAEGGSGQTETKVFEIGLANIGMNGATNNLDERSNELQLIAVSDDEDSDSDSDSDEDSDDHSGTGSDEDEDDTELCSVSNEEVELEDIEMVDGDLINQGLTDYKKEENNGNNGNNENIKSIKLNVNAGDLEEFGIFEELGETAGKQEVTETKVVEVAGLQPLMDEDHMKAESTDYKKMPLSKLRSIVVEKQLCEDASKMKKPELLELLKPFIGNMD